VEYRGVKKGNTGALYNYYGLNKMVNLYIMVLSAVQKALLVTNYNLILTGFINTSGKELKINQNILNVIINNRNIAVAGVIKNLNFKNLRPSRPT